MRAIIFASLIVLLPAVAAADNPEWAYPGAPPKDLPKPDPNKVVKVPGSDKEYKETEVNNAFGPPDWFPNEHAPMPKAVSNGARPDPRACALCHLPTGDGHPESASVAGLNANYIVRQLWDIQNGERTGSSAALMKAVVEKLSNDDMLAIAADVASKTP